LKTRIFPIVFLLLFTGMVFVLPAAPKAHALNPGFVISSNQTCFAGQPLTGKIHLTVVAAGDAIVVMTEDAVTSDNKPGVASVSDTLGNSFVISINATSYLSSITSYFGTFAYHSVAGFSGADTITVLNKYSSYWWCITAWDISGNAGSNVFSSSSSGVAGPTTGSGTLNAVSGAWSPKIPSSNATILGAFACDCGTGIVAGTDYTMATNHTGSSINEFMPAESSSGGVWASNEAPFTYSGGPYYSMGMAVSIQPALPVITTISTVKVVACNFYELECWWEPLIFYGMYVGLWVGIGATMSIRARSMTYLFGAAVSYASLYLILLGELPYPFALMAFIGAFAYGLRLDGVF